MEFDHVNETITGRVGALAGIAFANMLHLVPERTVTSVANEDITDLPVGLGLLMLVIHEYRPVTDSSSLLLQTSTNNGSSFNSTSDAYHWSRMYNTVSNGFSGNLNFTTGNAMLIADALGNVSGENTSSILFITGVRNAAIKTSMHAITLLGNTVGTLNPVVTAAQRTGAEDNNAFRLSSSSGNIATLTYSAYGLLA